MTSPIPTAAAISRLVGMLADKVVRVTRAVRPCDAAFAAIYADDSGRDMLVCVVDCSLAAAMGAALALIPPAVAIEQASAGRLSELLVANAYEVLNVLAAAFNEHAQRHLRLRTLCPIADAPKLSGIERIDFDVTIATYAMGRLGIVVLPS